MSNYLQEGIVWGILSQKEICEVLDSDWGKKGLSDSIGTMMKADMKLTEKQFMKKHGIEKHCMILEGKWYGNEREESK